MSNMREVLDNIGELPTLPDVVAKINQLVVSPDTSANDINNVISNDLALSAKILKVVNSPFYGFPRRITSITYAVVILGFRAVRNLALSAFILDAFGKGKDITAFDVHAFWDHSLCTAVAASSTANAVESESADDAFMGGLLHDVGKVVMSQFLPDDMEAVLREVKERDCLFLEAEKAILDYDHAEVGALLLEKWNLPQSIVDVVRYHHMPEVLEEESSELCTLIHFGDILARGLCFGSGGDARIPRLCAPAFERLGLSWDGVDDVMRETGEEAKKVTSFYAMA